MKEFKRIIDNSDNFVLYRLGQNANDNHLLIDDADKNDWWIHLNDYPSGHCIIERTEIDKDDIIYASNLIKENSKYRNFKKLKFCYTQVKNLKKTKNPGEVIILKKPEKFTL